MPLQKILVETKHQLFTFHFEVRKGFASPFFDAHSRHDQEYMQGRVALFNELLKLNEDLLDYEIDLGKLQWHVLHLIGEELGFTAPSFEADCIHFHDMCQVYKGHVIIIEGPQDFVNKFDSKLVIRLVDARTCLILSNQATVKVGGKHTYKFHLTIGERKIFRRPWLQIRNFDSDPDKPLGFRYFVA